MEDIATIEAIWDALVLKNIVTRQEIISYINRYGTPLNAILNILDDKKIATPYDIQVGTIAVHHMMRMSVLRPEMSYEELSKERIEFVKYLKSLPNPLLGSGQ